MSPTQQPPEDGEEDWFTTAPSVSAPPIEASAPPLSVVANLPLVDPEEPDWFTTPAAAPVYQDSEHDQCGTDAESLGDTDSGDESSDNESEWFGGQSELRETEFLPRSSVDVDPATSKSSWLRRNRSAGSLVLAATALLAVVGGGVLISAMSSADEPATPVADVASSVSLSSSVATATTAVTTPVAASPDAWCEGFGKGEPITPTSPDPGSAAIAGFEAAFYARDGVKARSFGAANTQLGSAEQIAAGAAQIPEHTEHCVLASPSGEGTYSVDIFERRPDGSSVQYRQSIVTTPTSDGSARIVAITTREGQ